MLCRHGRHTLHIDQALCAQRRSLHTMALAPHRAGAANQEVRSSFAALVNAITVLYPCNECIVRMNDEADNELYKMRAAIMALPLERIEEELTLWVFLYHNAVTNKIKNQDGNEQWIHLETEYKRNPQHERANVLRTLHKRWRPGGHLHCSAPPGAE